MNLVDLVVGHPAGDRALHDADGWHNWGEVRDRAAAAAAALRHAGVGPGERVVMAWPASAGFVATYLGILAAGAVAVPLNPASPALELASEMRAVSPALAVGAGGGVSRLADAARMLDRAVPVLASDGGGGDWDEAVHAAAASGAAPHLHPVDRLEDDVAVLLFTSGTAGAPKPAMLTHGNITANLAQLRAVPGLSARPDDVGLAALPLFHVFGLNVALGLCFATGGPLVVSERFDPDATLRQVRDHRVTVVVGVPAAFALWLRHLDTGAAAGVDPRPLSSVRLAVVGGAPVAPGVAVAAEERLGVVLHEGYGLTEAAPAVTATVADMRPEPGAVGRPLPGIEVRLVDEGGMDALVGDPGEIWVRGPNVFPGYWGDDQATASVLAAGGWLRTGDIGVSGAGGNLFVVGRCKDLIIVSGFNVYPGEVERVVAAVPGVAEVVVVGRPDPVSGEVVEAVVVAEDPTRPPSEAAIKDHCAARLAHYKCPSVVRLVPALPRTVGGEAMRRAMRNGQAAGPET